DLVAEHFQPDVEIRDRVPNRPPAYPPDVEVWIATGCDDTARCIILHPFVRLGGREDVHPRDQIAEGQLCRVVEAHCPDPAISRAAHRRRPVVLVRGRYRQNRSQANAAENWVLVRPGGGATVVRADVRPRPYGARPSGIEKYRIGNKP